MIYLNRSRKSVDISTFFRVQDDSTILNTILNNLEQCQNRTLFFVYFVNGNKGCNEV